MSGQTLTPIPKPRTVLVFQTLDMGCCFCISDYGVSQKKGCLAFREAVCWPTMTCSPLFWCCCYTEFFFWWVRSLSSLTATQPEQGAWEEDHPPKQTWKARRGPTRAANAGFHADQRAGSYEVLKGLLGGSVDLLSILRTLINHLITLVIPSINLHNKSLDPPSRVSLGLRAF